MSNAFENMSLATRGPSEPVVVAGASALAATDQSRAVAEVQASLVIAQSRPRNEMLARDRLMKACQRARLAEVAVYSFPRGGQAVTGPSIRLAEAAARAWGNMTYGFRELSRADGASEVESFAWDLETNTKAVRQFTVKHVRDKRGGPVKLTDERDIYEMIANQAQRRVRACILEIVPGDIIEDATDECDRTMRAALPQGQSVADAVKAMAEAFKAFGVSRAAIEKRLGHRLDACQPSEILGMKRVWTSLRDGFSDPKDWFDLDASEAGGVADDLNAKIAEAEAAKVEPAEKQEPEPQAAPEHAEEQPKRTRPTKEEMDAKRADAVLAVETAGLSLADVEKALNAYAKDWNSGQCERAMKMSSDHAKEASGKLTCPASGTTVRRDVECAKCVELGKCPETAA